MANQNDRNKISDTDIRNLGYLLSEFETAVSNYVQSVPNPIPLIPSQETNQFIRELISKTRDIVDLANKCNIVSRDGMVNDNLWPSIEVLDRARRNRRQSILMPNGHLKSLTSCVNDAVAHVKENYEILRNEAAGQTVELPSYTNPASWTPNKI